MVSKWALDQVDLPQTMCAERKIMTSHSKSLKSHVVSTMLHICCITGVRIPVRPTAATWTTSPTRFRRAFMHSTATSSASAWMHAHAKPIFPCVFSIAYQPLKEPIHVALRYRSIEGLHASLACLAAQTHRDWLRIHPIGPAAGEALPDHRRVRTFCFRRPSSQRRDICAGARTAVRYRRARRHPLLLCSDAVYFDEIHCIERLSGCLRRSDIAIAAPKLFSPDGLVQHAGCHLGIEGDMRATLINQGFGAHMGGGYLGVAELCCDFGSISSDCLLIAPHSRFRRPSRF